MPSDVVRMLQFLLDPATSALQPASWRPAVDVYRLADGWLLKFDLAGVRPQDIELHAVGRKLTVRGRRRDWVVEERLGCSAYSMEIAYSHFERTIELPCEVDKVRIESEYRDGMLLLRLNTEGCHE
jgi:HSP20 family protein